MWQRRDALHKELIGDQNVQNCIRRECQRRLLSYLAHCVKEQDLEELRRTLEQMENLLHHEEEGTLQQCPIYQDVSGQDPFSSSLFQMQCWMSRPEQFEESMPAAPNSEQ